MGRHILCVCVCAYYRIKTGCLIFTKTSHLINVTINTVRKKILRCWSHLSWSFQNWQLFYIFMHWRDLQTQPHHTQTHKRMFVSIYETPSSFFLFFYFTELLLTRTFKYRGRPGTVCGKSKSLSWGEVGLLCGCFTALALVFPACSENESSRQMSLLLISETGSAHLCVYPVSH